MQAIIYKATTQMFIGIIINIALIVPPKPNNIIKTAELSPMLYDIYAINIDNNIEQNLVLPQTKMNNKTSKYLIILVIKKEKGPISALKKLIKVLSLIFAMVILSAPLIPVKMPVTIATKKIKAKNTSKTLFVAIYFLAFCFAKYEKL